MSKQIKNINDFRDKFFRFLPVRIVKWLFEKASDVSVNCDGSFHKNNSRTTTRGGLSTDKAKETYEKIIAFLKNSFIGKIIFITIAVLIILIIVLIVLNLNSIYAFFKIIFSEKFNFSGYMNANYPKINM